MPRRCKPVLNGRSHSLRHGWIFQLQPPRDIATLLEVLAGAGVEALLPMESSSVGALSRHGSRAIRLQVGIPPLEGFLCAYDNRRTMDSAKAPGSRRRACSVPRKPKDWWWSSHARTWAPRGGSLLQGRRGPGRRWPAAMALASPSCRSSSRRHGGDAHRGPALRSAGRLVAHFTTRKLEQYPGSGGVTAMSVSTHDPSW